MSKVRLTGATSGYTEITAPAVAGNNTLTLPTGNGAPGQVLQTNGSGALSFAHGAASGPVFSAVRTSIQTPTLNTWVKVELNTEEFDVGNSFDSVTNYRFAPQIAGYYLLSFSVTSSTANAATIAYLYKNGSGFQQGSRHDTNSICSAGSCLTYMNGATDYIELFGYLSGGSFQAPGCRLSGVLARPA